MENLVGGVLIVILNVILIALTTKYYKQGKYQLALTLLIISGLSLRLFISFDLYLHEWDERYHALVAKNLISNPLKPMLYQFPLLAYDYKAWGSNHVWLHKQPLTLWSMAFSMLLFGKNVIALRLPSILLSTLGIFFTHRIGKLLFNQKVGLFAAFFFSINGFILEVTGGRIATDHVDLFFLSFITMAAYFAVKFSASKKIIFNLLCGIAIGLAILSKWLPALIVLPVWFFSIMHYQKFRKTEILKHAAVLLLTIIIIATPWQIYIHHTFPNEANWERHYNWLHLVEVIAPHGEPFYYHFNKMRIMFGELIYLPLIWFTYKSFRKKSNFKYWLIASWIWLPYLFFSIAKTKMPGYVLITAPAICIMAALFIHYLSIYQKRFKYKKFIGIVICLLIALPIRYSIERLKPFQKKKRTADWIAEAKELDSQMLNQKSIIFNTRYPIEIMFHTDIIAYEVVPDLDRLMELEEEGYRIFIDSRTGIPQELRELEFVEYIQISTQKQSER